MKLIVFLAAVALLAAWYYWPRPLGRRLPKHRVRRLKIWLHLRLAPGHGFATVFELWLKWSRFAATRKSSRIRPSLSARQRIRRPAEHAIMAGRAQYRHRLHVPLEEHLLVMSPPRMLKSAFLAHVILHYPGPVLSTTTKADVFRLTSGIRQPGPIHVFNPQGIGDVPSTFAWSPVAGCEDPAVAIRRADSFALSVSQKGVEDSTFWSSKASDYLRGYFAAAAIAGGDMRLVSRWVLGADPEQPERILAGAGYHQWAATLAELRGEAQKTAMTVRMVMTRAIGFMADPLLASSVIPSAQGFDIHGFLRGRGTLYMIAEPQHEDSPVAPLFAAMADEVHYQAELLGQASAGGRLDPPLLMALDEVVQICPVPLPVWLSDSGGKGIQIITVAHGEAQLASRWQDHGKQVILDTSSVKCFLPGITDVATLEAGSKLCGQTAYREQGADQFSRHDVMTPQMIRELPTAFALVIRSNHAPVIARLPRAWRDRAYRKARRHGQAVAVLTPAAALAVPEPAVPAGTRDFEPEPVLAGAGRGQPGQPGSGEPYAWEKPGRDD